MSNSQEIEHLLEQGYATMRTSPGGLRRADTDPSMTGLKDYRRGRVLQYAKPSALARTESEDELHLPVRTDDEKKPPDFSVLSHVPTAVSPAESDDDVDDGTPLDEMIDRVFREVDKISEEQPCPEPTPQVKLRNEFFDVLHETSESLREVVEVLDTLAYKYGQVPLRHIERTVLLLTRSDIIDSLCLDATESVASIREWAREHNKRVEQQVLAAMSRKPEPAVKRA